MEIKLKQENEATVADLIGRIDTNTSADFQKQLEEYYTKEGFSLILDFENLDFVSSAGLRVLL